MEAAALSEAWVREMGRRALVLEAHHSTHIEGTRLTQTLAEQLLEGRLVPEADPHDVRELLNYKKALEFVSRYLEDGGPITEALVREIHKRLVEGVRGGAAAPGRYRRIQNYVVNLVTGETDRDAGACPVVTRSIEWIYLTGTILGSVRKIRTRPAVSATHPGMVEVATGRNTGRW